MTNSLIAICIIIILLLISIIDFYALDFEKNVYKYHIIESFEFKVGLKQCL